MRAPLSHIPALPVSTGFVAGILLYANGCTAWPVAAFTALASIGLYLIKLRYFAVIAASIIAGWWLAGIHAPRPLPECLDDGLPHTAVGIVKKTGTSNGIQRSVVTVAASDSHGGFRCALTVPSLEPRIHIGDTVWIKAVFERPGQALNLPDETDYTSFYKIDGIAATAFTHAENIIVTEPSVRPLAHIFEKARQWFINAIVSSPIHPATAAFLTATLTGDDELLSEELQEDFRATGLAHILALSGFHVGIIALIVSALLFPLRAWSRIGRASRLSAIIVAVWGYAFMTGAAPSVTRAAVMVSAYCIARLMQRGQSPYNALAIASLVILSINPYALWSPGFQLSFASVLSILAFAEKLNPFPPKQKWPHRLAAAFCLPSAALLGTAVISAIYFHRLPLLSIITNAAAGAILPLLLGGGVILSMATASGMYIPLLGNAVDFLYRLIETIAGTAAEWPFAEISGIFPGRTVTLAAIAAIATFAVALHLHNRFAWRSFAIALAVFVCAIPLTADTLPTEEFYVCRTRSRTDIITRLGHKAHLYTTAPDNDRNDVLETCRKRYGSWLMRRDAELTIAEPINGRYIVSTGKTFVIVADTLPDSVPEIHTDYAIVCRGFKGSIDDIVATFRPDTVIIARDNTRRRDSIYRRASSPAISMRERRFSAVNR